MSWSNSCARTKKRLVCSGVFLVTISYFVTVLPVFAKRLSFELPTYEKLLTGAGPSTNDVKKASNTPSRKRQLAPLKLKNDDHEQSSSISTTTSETTNKLKVTVSESFFIAKEQANVDGQSKSLIKSKTKSLDPLQKKIATKEANKVAVLPLALVKSDEESEKESETVADLEKMQLMELWQATISRCPDIQFVINKLQPSSNQGHVTSIMMKMLSGALFGVLNAAPLLTPVPNMGIYAGSSLGTSMLHNLYMTQEAKSLKKYQISQEQATMLYKMVRDIADRLVDKYRDYKKQATALVRANTDLQDLQAMVAEARSSQDAAKQVEMEYTLRKAQRDIDTIVDEVRRNRQALIDLAGSDAVAKLDKQFCEEQQALTKLTGDPSLQANCLKIPVQQTAAKPAVQYQ